MTRSRITSIAIVAVLFCSSRMWAQENSASSRPSNENGAASFYFSTGTSFGFPADRAFVITNQGSIISPSKTVLPNVGIGATIRAWRFIAPFVDLTAIDAGTAMAQVGSVQSQVQDKNTFLFNGGVRLIGSKSRVRPYVQFGGGMLHSSGTATFTLGNQSTTASLSSSAASVTYGGGVQFFYGHRWGSEVGFDGFHANKQLTTGGQNFSRFYVTLFFQTKPTVQ